MPNRGEQFNRVAKALKLADALDEAVTITNPKMVEQVILAIPDQLWRDLTGSDYVPSVKTKMAIVAVLEHRLA